MRFDVQEQGNSCWLVPVRENELDDLLSVQMVEIVSTEIPASPGWKDHYRWLASACVVLPTGFVMGDMSGLGGWSDLYHEARIHIRHTHAPDLPIGYREATEEEIYYFRVYKAMVKTSEKEKSFRCLTEYCAWALSQMRIHKIDKLMSL